MTFVLLFLGILLENITIAHCSNEGWNVKIFLPELRRKYRDLDVNDLYLGDEKTNCTGVLSGDYLVFDKKFEFCQTTEKVWNEYVFRTYLKMMFIVKSVAHI